MTGVTDVTDGLENVNNGVSRLFGKSNPICAVIGQALCCTYDVVPQSLLILMIRAEIPIFSYFS